MLIDLLKTANVHFSAVIGHSSGEIAAAYAASYLTARDAICVAYYRGLHCKKAGSPNGEIKGAMIAVGTSVDDAMELCDVEEFSGRISVAAINSSTSVTISGDEDAIEELQAVLDDEKKFNRRLRVDQAYHSKHMLPCFDPYVESLRRANVKALRPSSSQCIWFSSVYDGRPIDSELRLSDLYWADNMTKPVLFSQALTAAVFAGAAFEAVLEISPHPALQGPANQSIQDAMHRSIPYCGTLSREQNATTAFSRCLGFLWSYLGKASVKLSQCEVTISMEGQRQFNVLKGLPAYQWNHETKHWHESRRSRQMRLRQKPFHPLLGDASPDSAPHSWRWKNVLNPNEIEWLDGHQVQGQIVFPAAGYVSTALEAVRVLAGERIISLMELRDFYIRQAIMFEGDDSGIEVLIELSQVSQLRSDCIVTKFTYSAALGGQAADFSLVADGELKVLLGNSTLSLLPERRPTPHLINVEQNRLYNFMESMGYNPTGPFHSLSTLKRKLGVASCRAKRASTDDAGLLLVHPVDLDAAFQSVMLAYSYPGDDQLRNLHLPISILRLRINPVVLASQNIQDEFLTVDSTCNRSDRASPGSGFSGDANLYTDSCSNAAIQVDQVRLKSLGAAANGDRNVFYKIHWVHSTPDGTVAADGIPVTQDDTDLLWVLSRIASYFLRKFDEDVPKHSPLRSESPLCHYLNYAQHMTTLLRSSEHKYAKKEWVNDALDDILDEIKGKGCAFFHFFDHLLSFEGCIN